MNLDFQNGGNKALTLSAISSNKAIAIKSMPTTLNGKATARISFALHTETAGTFTTRFTIHYGNATAAKDYLFDLTGTVKAPVVVVPPTTPTDPTTPTPPTTSVAGGRPFGVNWNISSDIPDQNYDAAVKMATDAGIQAVRFYLGAQLSGGSDILNQSTDKAGTKNPRSLAQKLNSMIPVAAKFKRAGVHVTIVIAPPEGVDAGTAGLPPAGGNSSTLCDGLTKIYNFRVNGQIAASAIDLWELGNEVNMNNYWQRTSEGNRTYDYIASYLKPGAKCLHAITTT